MEYITQEYVGDPSLHSVVRAEDLPLEVNHSLLAQSEIDALRGEVQSLRYNLMLAQGEVARLKDMVDNPNELPKFLGFPFRYYDDSEEDCKRLTYQVFYCGTWRDINTCTLSFNHKEAVEEIINMINREASK